MRLFFIAIMLCFSSTAATAQGLNFCEDAWVTRNLIFDRAGYCFGSTLGQSLFDNSNCTTNTASAPQAYAENIAWVRGDEERIGCNINTARPAWPSIRAVHDFYNQFWTVPVRFDGGFGCLGYLGPTVQVHAGADASTPVLGQLSAGQFYSDIHHGINGWAFITVTTGANGQEVVTGWATGFTSDCVDMAG